MFHQNQSIGGDKDRDVVWPMLLNCGDKPITVQKCVQNGGRRYLSNLEHRTSMALNLELKKLLKYLNPYLWKINIIYFVLNSFLMVVSLLFRKLLREFADSLRKTNFTLCYKVPLSSGIANVLNGFLNYSRPTL